MGAIKTAAQATANWTAAMGSAKTSQAYVAGTGAVTESPMAAAAAQGVKAATNYSNSINSGQWAAALNSVSTASWKQSCAQGASRLASGAAKGASKYTAAINALQPVYAQMRQASQSMPAGTSGAQKAAAAISVLEAAGKKGRASSG
jgi:hypothetical protein